MPLSWSEVKNKALAFSKRWEDATREDADAKPFWLESFEIFGISDKRVANPQARCACVSTKSITQGEQVGVLWGWMLSQGVCIHFAYRTFSWTNEARGKAAVHCVIVGFGLQDRPDKTIYEYADIKGAPLVVAATNINLYLIDA